MRVLMIVASGALFALAACTSDPYACSDASQCINGDIAGVCQLSGYCSFPDDSCPSGQRYGSHAGGGLAGVCVPIDPDETDSSTDASSGSDSGSTTGVSEPTTTAETADPDSTAGCVPDCAGRVCGPDGCGGSCAPGCPVDESCGVDGTCLPGCSPWRVQHGTHVSSIRFDHTGNLLATGDDAGTGWVRRVSACEGDVIAEASFVVPGAEYVRAMDAAPTDTGWAIIGQRVYTGVVPGEAFIAHLSQGELATEWEQALSAPLEEGWAIGTVAADDWWMTGVASIAAANQRPWMFRTDATGEGCGFSAAPQSMALGYTRALEVDGSAVYAAGSLGNLAYIARFDVASCDAELCGCEPDWAYQFEVGASLTEIRGLTVVDGVLLAGGFALDTPGSSDYAGFVARITPGNATERDVTQLWVRDPTPEFDAVLELSHRGGVLFVPMLTDYDGTDEQTARGMLTALSTDLDASESWTTDISGVGLLYDVVADDDGVYVAGRDTDSGWILRCTTDGDCPD